jgi:hypothetical protein
MDPLFKMRPGLFLIPEVKKNAGSSEGIATQKKFTAGECQGAIQIIPVMYLQNIVFTQIGESFPGNEGPYLSIMVVLLLPADDLLQPLIFFFQKTFDISLQGTKGNPDKHGSVRVNLNGKGFLASMAAYQRIGQL